MADYNDPDSSNTLPITAEVGSEGGTYTDPLNQKSTLEGDVPRVEDAVRTVHPERPRPGACAEGLSPEPQGAADGVRFPKGVPPHIDGDPDGK